ncbi:unnamed protein product [Orchesella dallaii]
MICVSDGNWKAIVSGIFILYSVQLACSQQHQHQGGSPHEMLWPTSLSFHETKTNAMLGEAILKRVYSRIGFTDNIIRAEIDTLFDRLKEVIEKRLRKCERKRRRAGSVKNLNLESMYGHPNTTYQRRTRKQANG